MPLFEVWNDEEDAPSIETRDMHEADSPEEAAKMWLSERQRDGIMYVAVRNNDTSEIATLTARGIWTVTHNNRFKSLDALGFEKSCPPDSSEQAED